MKASIKKIGGVTAVVIPDELLDQVGLDVGDEVSISADKGCLIMEPQVNEELSLVEILLECKSADMSLDSDDKAWLGEPPKGIEEQ